ncbi:MAG: hypothetical protein KA118_12300 [Verrucomicrobia bacterium]|nr:hypothetical protein [Verrucomicrobiota bacterium]
MRFSVDTKDPHAVAGHVLAIYRAGFPEGDPAFVPRVFEWAVDCFAGRYANYQAIDAPYHDLEHTMQGTVCLADLMRGWLEAGEAPVLTQPVFEKALVAMLLHDTGYLKTREDAQGTGAKYTPIHEDRSAGFAARLLTEKQYPLLFVRSVQQMIHCTSMHTDPRQLPFSSAVERRAGCALGTADLLGQMAADDYVDKLPVLFEEYEESARYNPTRGAGSTHFASPEDLLRQTPAFWERYVWPRLNRQLQGVHRFLNRPCPNGPNPYLDGVEANLNRVRRQLAESG